MTLRCFRKLLVVFSVICFCHLSNAQPAPAPGNTPKENKPYKILTSGKHVTVKSSKEIKSVMVWTASGHRIVEEKAVNATSFSFNVNVAGKVFFIMIRYEGSKPYTEKVGVQ